MIYYTEDHEYIRIEGDTGIVGISDYAQKQLGDVVYVELPKVGTQVARGQDTAVVESVKVASEIYSPVSGEITAINDDLVNDPSLVNKDPLNAWFFKVRMSAPDETKQLKSEDDYTAYLANLA